MQPRYACISALRSTTIGCGDEKILCGRRKGPSSPERLAEDMCRVRNGGFGAIQPRDTRIESIAWGNLITAQPRDTPT